MRGITPRRYRLDPTGSSPNNKVVNEPRHIGFENKNRVFQPRAGAFYVDSMYLVDAQTHQPLVRERDFKCIHLDTANTHKFGKAIAFMVVITNPSVSSDVYGSYQAVGGMSSYLVPVINQLIPMLENDDRTLSWNNIVDRPPAFPPGPHYHDVGDFYGFEYMVLSLMQISELITDKDIDDHVPIVNFLSIVETEFATRWNAFLADINAHIGRRDNPHVDEITDVNTYSKTTIDSLLLQKLDRVATAVNASRIFGSVWSDVYAFIRQNYDAAALGDGAFAGQRLGANYNQALAQVLTTNGWKSIQEVISATDPIYVGTSSLASVKTTFQASPVGTHINWLEGGWPWVSYHVVRTGPNYDDWMFV